MYARIETMTMLACSMGPNAYAQTLDHKKTARKTNALMAVQETIVSKCVEGLDTSISSTPMPTEPQLMIGAVETHCKTCITKNGIPIWATVAIQVSHQPPTRFLQCWTKLMLGEKLAKEGFISR